MHAERERERENICADFTTLPPRDRGEVVGDALPVADVQLQHFKVTKRSGVCGVEYNPSGKLPAEPRWMRRPCQAHVTSLSFTTFIILVDDSRD